jgi:hypothetical protein
MAHELLHCHKIHASIKQTSAKGMAQNMGCNFFNAGMVGVLTNDVLDAHWSEAVPALAYENMGIVHLGALSEVGLQRSARIQV